MVDDGEGEKDEREFESERNVADAGRHHFASTPLRQRLSHPLLLKERWAYIAVDPCMRWDVTACQLWPLVPRNCGH